MDPAIKFLKPGVLTTVQDQGRSNYSASGISQGGAYDLSSLALANRLVGNPPIAAGLELTMFGPVLKALRPFCMSVVGADIHCEIQGPGKKALFFPTRRPVFVKAGTQLGFGTIAGGGRAWMAFSGGIRADPILDSLSSHLAANIKPVTISSNSLLNLKSIEEWVIVNRLLKAMDRTLDSIKSSSFGETLNFFQSDGIIFPRWFVPDYRQDQAEIKWVRVLKGRHFSMLAKSDQESLLKTRWTVDSSSNRQGIILSGKALSTKSMTSIKSEPVRFGTVQLPPSGLPIILGVEHQTTGGYPRVLEVISSDRPLLARLTGGTRFTFELVDQAMAIRLASELDTHTKWQQKAIALKLGGLLHT